MTSSFLSLSRAATLITIVVLVWPINIPLPLPQFDIAALPLPYLAPSMGMAEITALSAVAAYMLAGWPNLAAARSGKRKLFVLPLAGLILFEALSMAWSPHQGLAALQAAHMLVWAAFALLIMCADWPEASMALAVLAGLMIHVAVGFIQLAVQPVVEIIPQNSGISVVFNGAEHWRRVYGVSAHPNILGGYLVVGVILIAGLMMTTRQKRRRFWLSAAWLLCWITLLLTFSRSAWLGALGGGCAALLLLLRGERLNRRSIRWPLMLAGASLLSVIAFAAEFQAFLVNRLVVTLVPYEAQAIAARLDAARAAWQMFAAHPLTGVGLAQSIVVMSAGAAAPIDWIHNFPLLAAAELGLGGLIPIGLLAIAMSATGVRRWQSRSISVWQALVGGGLIALVIVMQFDHYVWTAAPGGLLWAWLTGWWMRGNYGIASPTTAS